jgi:hypothetical protein
VQNVEVMPSNQNIKLAHQTRYVHKDVKIVCFKNVKSNTIAKHTHWLIAMGPLQIWQNLQLTYCICHREKIILVPHTLII